MKNGVNKMHPLFAISNQFKVFCLVHDKKLQ